MFLIGWIFQALAQSAALKKGLGVGSGLGIIAGLIYASNAEYTNKEVAKLRVEQGQIWEQHRREEALIMSNLNSTLSDLKIGVSRIDDRTFYLYKRELEKNKGQ